MCYVIELMDKYIPSDFLTVTVEKNEGIKMDYVKWTMTSDHEYLRVALGFMWSTLDIPLRFNSFFGDILNQEITTVQTIRNPLKCHPDPDYVSEQQWLVNDFFDKDFSPCPVKCIPFQMRGYRYVNSSSNLKNCNNLDDQVCNGGPTVWKELEKRFANRMKPCRVSSYDQSLREMKDMTYMGDEENEASSLFTNKDISPVETEVHLYGFSDMIGTVGGSLGVAVGFSVFAVISCCIDNLLELFNIFQSKRYKKSPFVQERSHIPIYIGGRIITKSMVIDNPC